MSSVLILEPNHGGHNAAYLRWIVEGFLQADVRVRLATLEGPLRNDEHMQALVKDHGGEMDLALLDGDITPALRRSGLGTWQVARREAQYYRLLRKFYRAVRRRPAEPVLVPYLDYCAYAVALRGSPFGESPWSGVVMRLAFHFQDMGVLAPHVGWANLKRRLFTRLLRTRHLQTLFSIDSTLVKYYETREPDLAAKRLRFLPEPGEIHGKLTREEARSELGIPPSARVVLVYGELRGRKGVDALLEATTSSEFPGDAHLLLAGTQYPEVKAVFETAAAARLRAAGRLHEDNRILAGEDEYRVFAAADIVWLGYRGHYTMSAVLIQAGKMRRPVVACREGLIGKFTHERKLGLTVDTADHDAVAKSISELCKDRQLARRLGKNGWELFADRDARTFAETICREFPAGRPSVADLAVGTSQKTGRRVEPRPGQDLSENSMVSAERST